MGMFSFIKEAGEKLFGHKKVEEAAAAAAADPAHKPTLDELNAQAAAGIKTYIETQNLGATGLFVSFDGASGKVTVQGEAPTMEAVEKVTLCCGNVGGVSERIPRRGAWRHTERHCQGVLRQCQQIHGHL
jgi:hypothetical protein